jgi:hypothetical protein
MTEKEGIKQLHPGVQVIPVCLQNMRHKAGQTLSPVTSFRTAHNRNMACKGKQGFKHKNYLWLLSDHRSSILIIIYDQLQEPLHTNVFRSAFHFSPYAKSEILKE